MKHRLSFAYFNILADNLLEVTVDDGVEMSLEMIEECHQFIDKHFKGDFGMLVNKINQYTYTYEAALSIASYDNMKAVAFVYYTPKSKKSVAILKDIRAADEWNHKTFSGLELGWQQAFTWLTKELSVLTVK